MTERIFFDTDITLYCFDTREPREQERAKDLLAYGASSGLGIVSYQVLQEFCCAASNTRRMTLATGKIMAFVTHFFEPMNRVPMLVLHLAPLMVPMMVLHLAQALQTKENTQYAFYDCLILAAAQQAGFTTVYSEDMQHQQTVGGVRIVNPFIDAVHDIACAS